MSRDLAPTKYPLFIEDRIIELGKTLQTVRSKEAFTQVFTEDRATILAESIHVQRAVRLPYPAAGFRNQNASIIRLVVAR